ncbi:MAG: DUF4412 domain-containing protein [Bacteroidota bacterium]
MKKLIFSTALLVSLLSVNLFAQKNGTFFEYKLSTTKGATGSIKTYYAAQGSRTEMQLSNPQLPMAGINFTSITKSAEPNMVFILNERDNTYIATGIQQNNVIRNGGDSRIVKIVGKEKAGTYNCTHAIVTEGNDSREYWMTTEIPDYETYNKINADNKYMGYGNDQAILLKNGVAGFTVKMISKDSHNGDVTTMEMITIQTKNLDTNLFEIPANYKASAITAPYMQGIDMNKFQNMTPEERTKYIEEMKKGQ